MKLKIKQLCNKENVRIQITDFELMNVCIYGCDACFHFEIRDKETNFLLLSDSEIIENAFMGVDDVDEIYYFLEDKGIDFSEEYDEDFSNLPIDLQEEFDEYLFNTYDNVYHETLFDGEESTMECYIDKIMHQLDPDKNKFYLIRGKKIAWIKITSDYNGFHLHSDDVEIKKVYNVDEEDWIYEIEGIFFSVTGYSNNLKIHYYKRDNTCKFIVTAEKYDNNWFPDYWGKIGDVLYGYNRIKE